MRKALIFLIKVYKYCLAPFLPLGCRFTPTCSQYTIDAINKYGTLKGLYLSLMRILRCHPFHPGGYDPVK